MMYEYWLASIYPLSDRKKRCLREAYGDGEQVYNNIEETNLHFQEFLEAKDVEIILKAGKKGKSQLQNEWDRLKEKNICFVPYYTPEYPEKLHYIPDPPYALYVKGRLPYENAPAVAIVGARKCTSYGETMALEYGEALALAGVQVISGMARGIDGAGQRGALNGGGRTFAVLGCGADVCYPRDHIGLYMDIQAGGGILSEQIPGQPPLPMYFPARNRIISGLADAVLVMEARERSGSLITADLALEQGKDVYALPGPVTSPLSQGCHQLIRQGAEILISPEELLAEMRIQAPESCRKTAENKKVLETPENMVYSCLDLFPKGISQLIQETGLSAQELMERLITLELKGYIREVSKNYYIKVRK